MRLATLIILSLAATHTQAMQFTIGPMAQYKADFLSSSERGVGLAPFIEVHRDDENVRPETADAERLDIWSERDWEAGVAFNVSAGRDGGDARDAGFTGLDEIDTTFEIGAYALKRFGGIEIGVDLLRGINGHKGFVLTPELAYESDNEARLRWRIAAQASWANQRYQREFFGTEGVRFNNAPLANYSPDSGFRDIGLRFAMIYDLAPRWSLVGIAGVNRYLGDAEDSPLVAVGEDTDPLVGIGVAYTF